jgi:hypothetical protein
VEENRRQRNARRCDGRAGGGPVAEAATPAAASAAQEINPGIDYPILSAGHYIFVRQEERIAPEDWNNLELDQSEGRLKIINPQPPSDTGNATTKKLRAAQMQDKFYREHTYLVIQIRKNLPEAQYTAATYDTLYEALHNTSVLTDNTKVSDIKKATTELIQSHSSSNLLVKLKNEFNSIVVAHINPATKTNTAYVDACVTGFVNDLSESRKAGDGRLQDPDLLELCKVMALSIPNAGEKLSYGKLVTSIDEQTKAAMAEALKQYVTSD